ncbi:MAG TPA: O-antigen ligase family protein [Desulfobulbaceae bacterium]|nr:O-antigen ligase family protein [Desulfobulbaceae bacterium]
MDEYRVMERVQRIRVGAGRLNRMLPALLACALPLSTSAVSVLSLCILLFWLLEGKFAQKWHVIKTNPVAIAVLAYLFVLTVGLLWSPDVKAGLLVLQARWKIALLPVFLTAIKSDRRSFYTWGFLAGLAAAMLMTYLAWFGILHYSDISEHHLTHNTFHVVYNPLLAFGIYLVMHEAVWGKIRKSFRMGLFLSAAIMTFNMFITEGRAGQLVFFVLLALLVVQLFSGNRVKAVAAVCLLVPIMFYAGYRLSPVFHNRVDAAWYEIAQFRTNPNTSVGQRLQFWCNSWRIIQQHPVLGVGTGGFQKAYADINHELSPACVATDNPHNQYVLVVAMVGIPGIIALVMIFVVMFRQAWKSHDHWRRVRFAFPLFFLTIMLTESYLKVYETGFFFSLFGAVFYALPLDNNLPDPGKSGIGKPVR